jgi:ribonuclease-3
MEGDLTRYKSLVVSGANLARMAGNIGLGDVIFMSSAEARTGGRRRSSILEDAYEALIGAIYLDGGWPAARDFVTRNILNQLDLEKLNSRHRNHKSVLLEFVQARGLGAPVYRVIKEEGPDHQKKFVVRVWVGEIPLATGEGTAKKKAEQAAAAAAMKALSTPNSKLLNKLKS